MHGRHFHAREEVVPEHQADGRGREDSRGALDDERQQHIQVRLIADRHQDFLDAAKFAVTPFTHARAHGDQLQQRSQRHPIRGQEGDFAALLFVADAHDVNVAHRLDAHQDGRGGMEEFQPGDQAGAVIAQRRNDTRLSVANERLQEIGGGQNLFGCKVIGIDGHQLVPVRRINLLGGVGHAGHEGDIALQRYTQVRQQAHENVIDIELALLLQITDRIDGAAERVQQAPVLECLALIVGPVAVRDHAVFAFSSNWLTRPTYSSTSKGFSR